MKQKIIYKPLQGFRKPPKGGQAKQFISVDAPKESPTGLFGISESINTGFSQYRNFKKLRCLGLALFFCGFSSLLRGQQLPFFSQYMSNSLLWNPAVAGTKKAFDFRASYRNQWVGFDGAPKTEYVSVNSRLSNGKLGLGCFVYKDETGPTSRMSYSGSLAAHLRFPDVEASFGLTGSLVQYTFQGQKAFLQRPGDPVFDQTATQVKNVPDMGLGLLLYNDRFHVGLSAMSFIKSTISFRAKDTVTSYETALKSHVYFSFGYNFSANPDYVWENSFYTNYVRSSPIMLAYSLRLFYKNKWITGTSIRIGDAVVAHLGFIFSEAMQISYSYDLITNGIRKGTSGSHEVLFVYSMKEKKKKRKKNEEFQRQKYMYMF